MENGFVSPRAEAFPAGLRVLVVDDDPTWLKILEKMLRKCSYEVTTCGLARVALDMLRERKDRFDIVISDVNMPDMDGFKLLEHVGLEMDLPVIMMSVDGETSRVMKGVHHGACDYLLKPVRMKELRNIWQHVLRKKIHEVKGIESHDSSEDMQLLRNGSDEFDDGHSQSGCDLNLAKKRKDLENEEYDEHEFNDPSALKKARVVWSVDLHQKFVNAVNQIGFDKVGPKKILDLMNVPGLTRENVASHLQKYRLYLSRLQKQNEPKTSFGGITQSELSSKNTTAGNFGHQSSITMLQNNSANSIGCSSNQIVVRDMVSEIREDDLKSMISKFPVTYTKKALASDVPNTQKVNVVSQIGQVLSFSSMVPPFESTISEQKPWSGELPVMQFMQHPKQDRETYLRLEQGFSHLQLPGQQHHIRVDLLQTTPSVCVRTSVTDRDKKGPSQIKPSCTDYKSPIDSFSVQLPHDIVNPRDSVARSIISGFPGTKNHDLVQTRANDLESLSQNSILKNGSTLALAPPYDDFQQLCSLQAYGCFESFGLNGMDFFDYNDSESITDLQSQLYDGLRFNYDYLCDSMEYPVIEEGLFIS